MKISDLKTFDICDYIKTDEEIIEYFKQVVEDGDKDQLKRALKNIAKIKGLEDENDN